MAQVGQLIEMDASSDKPNFNKKEGILGFMMKAGATDNLSPGPESQEPLHQQLLAMYDTVHQQSLFDVVSQDDIDAGRTTRVIFASVASIQGTETTPVEEPLWDKTDIAICVNFRANNVTAEGEARQLRAIAIVPRDKFQTIYELMARKPETAFAFVRASNGGPIRQHDGQPAEILPGQRVTIMPNTAVGGALKQQVTSKLFPSDFNPNPPRF